MRKKTILIIDDEESYCRLLKLNIEDNDEYEAIYATDAPAGIGLVQTQKPDLILLDMRMPQMSGLEALKQIKVIAPDVPVAIVSGVWDEQEAKSALQAGAYEYITKPVNFGYLRTAILVKLF